jgi:predicted glycosyltransferase
MDRVRTAIFYDTEIAKVTNWFSYPMADYVCTPDCYQKRVRGNHIRYPGYHELAYLHPNRFTADLNIVRSAGVDPTLRYFIVRFVSYAASHDLGTSGLTTPRKVDLVKLLAQYGRVLISSESQLPPELEAYRLAIPASQIHHFLAFASLLVGESATMASECAVLGVPSFYISPAGRGYTDEQERRYGLVFNFTGKLFYGDWLVKIREFLEEPRMVTRARQGHTRLLADKIDTTNWMIEFFEREFRTHFSTT